MLQERRRCGSLDDPAAHAGLEAHARLAHICPGISKNREDLGVVAEFHADLFEQLVGVRLDQAQPLLVENVEGSDPTADVGAPWLRRSALGRRAARPRECAGGPSVTDGTRSSDICSSRPSGETFFVTDAAAKPRIPGVIRHFAQLLRGKLLAQNGHGERFALDTRPHIGER